MTCNLSDPIFTDEAAAVAHMEHSRWANGVICPLCGADRAKKMGGETQAGMFLCPDCRGKFTVRTGTVFERSHIPVHKWLLAMHLLASSKKGISTHQLHRMLGITYKSAWFMTMRIREAMAPASSSPIGGEGKTVEADETYIGKKDGKRKAKGAGGYGHKRTVMTLVERGGKAHSFHLDSPKEVKATIREHLDPATTLHTDGAPAYKGLVPDHHAVDHSKEYVTAEGVHTNTLEGFFSVFKRGMVGTYQHCGEQHLQRYLTEFDFRYNTRAKLGVSDASRAALILKGAEGKRLTYRQPDKA